jgi:hypothetical protein
MKFISEKNSKLKNKFEIKFLLNIFLYNKINRFKNGLNIYVQICSI